MSDIVILPFLELHTDCLILDIFLDKMYQHMTCWTAVQEGLMKWGWFVYDRINYYYSLLITTVSIDNV